jgi:5-(carboxyamino)imidazole ribonucleotide mutase
VTTVPDLVDLFEAEAARDRPGAETPDVGVVMGSDSDLDVMAGAHDALTDLGFTEVTDYDDPPTGYSFESWVVSAHRTPDLLYAYAETAAARGLDVIVAGAGGKSADLPNMTASLAYPVPVVGVPVQEQSVDSVIGMPTGAPLTAVDAGKSYNAGLSAAQFLATDDPELADRLRDRHAERRDGVADTSGALHEQGTEDFRADRD